ncbi:MAG: UDP-glucose/GDP-mannose dehydrogenase family protein [Acidobacteria bacterium]|nr:MAG: UDP-glucose/GDP-mannose dehydrogenase family protein [Acidobacteriota bacterium]
MLSTISVIGLGKLGAPIAACFAARGFQVIAVDIDAQKADAIGRGAPPVHEPRLAELLKESKGRLRATQDTEAAIRDSEATFIVVGTPSEPDGGFSLRYVIPTCEAIGRALRNKNSFHLVVLTSTVMPGSTGGEIKSALERASGKRCGQDFGLCYSPEFIALGTVIRDFYYPDFLLIGESDPRAGDLLSDVYARTCKNSPTIARMNFINAEITKLAVNTYITTKISYANMLARLCEKLPEADVSVVTYALGLDSRIGSKYLKGAVSYGGPCFPRDNRAFAEATDRFNRAQIATLAGLVKSHQSGSLPIGILGLTYKPDTDVVEESFGLLLALELASASFPIVVFDPSADLPRTFAVHKSVRIAASAEDCIAQSAIVVLATPWQQFRDLPGSAWMQPFRSGPSFHATRRVVIDCWRSLPHLEGSQNVHYIRLGAPSPAPQPSTATISAA